VAIGCERLLVAAGAWSSQLDGLFGFHIPVDPIKGQMLRLDLPESALKPIVHTKEFYLAPRTGLGVIVGATMEEAGFDTSVDEEVIAHFKQQAAEILPAAASAKVVESWAGLRPRPQDGQPILGRLPAEPNRGTSNIWLATGHYRNGILLSGITGLIMASMILEEE